MDEEIIINLKIIPSREILKDKIDKITLRKGSTVKDLLDVLYRDYVKKSSQLGEDAEKVNIFRGYILMKNSITIGSFDKDGFKPFRESDLQLKDGDEITIMFPPSGG
ncbi:MAG: MoaD/ThiS family protein [Aigarchaeota archaeon]|nr:MoaD/ThiS family protein [Aigarchaeota archaeon]MCX8192265.1 MoaD/ThiS family protein [Nitrososphaeria archaeon]MDW7986127.1 MoaD/ThiS family protein [Nitrososphaerota archaeon]